MLKTPAASFGSTFLASEQDLAGEVTKKLLSNGSIVINLYIASLLLLGSGPITLYHLLGIALLLITTIVSISFATTFRNNSYYLINQCAILVLPIFMEAYISKSWISYGLVIAIFVLFSAAYDQTPIFIVCLTAAPAIQYWVVSQNFNGIIDNQDLKLLNSYFSTTWVLIAGIGVRVARLVYLDYCKQIDDQLFGLQDQLQEAELRQSSLNLKDHINLAIHGTLLNTLISYHLLPDKLNKQKELSKDITKDLEKIEDIGTFQRADEFQNRIEQLLNEQGHLVEFASMELNSELEYFADSLIEIFREIGLNTKKHSQSRKFKIALTHQLNQFQLEIIEIFPHKLDADSVEKKIIGANRSVSLSRIVNSSRFDLKISAVSNLDGLLYRIKIPKKLQPYEVISRINYLRKRSVNRNIELLTTISILYSFLALIGFIFLRVPIYVEVIVLLANLLIAYEVWSKKKSIILPLAAQVSLLTIIPYILFLDEKCQNLLYTPWLFNAILGAILYSISVASNPFFKWGPGVLFIAENLATKLYFPQECNTLLDGSTPGFIFVLIFGYFMAKLRGRNTNLDASLETSIKASLASNDELIEYNLFQRNKLLNQARTWANKLDQSVMDKEKFETSLHIWIQLIRAYLICSQYFGIQYFRQLYSIILERLYVERPTKLTLLTNSITESSTSTLPNLEEMDLANLKQEIEILIKQDDVLKLDLIYMNKK